MTIGGAHETWGRIGEAEYEPLESSGNGNMEGTLHVPLPHLALTPNQDLARSLCRYEA